MGALRRPSTRISGLNEITQLAITYRPLTPGTRQSRPKILKYRQVLPITYQMGASKTFLVILSTIHAGALLASDFYLPRIGPAPLRFAMVSAKSKTYVWPVPLIPTNSVNNASAVNSLPDSNAATNSAITLSSPAIPQTNNIPTLASSEMSVSSPFGPTQPPVGADGNPLSASNLLIVTPQMLADYFKATLTGTDKLSTNAARADIPFNPPTPKPLSSEAIYRTQ